MKIGFFFQDNGPVSKGIAGFAGRMIDSVRQSMPGVEIWQLSDEDTYRIPGVDGVKRLSTLHEMPMAVRRVSLHSLCDGEWLFIDTDVLIQRDVSEVFHFEFDVALTNRDDTITYESEYAKVMPYNIGVVFSRSPAFWRTVRGYLELMPNHFQQWEGDQRVVAGIMAHANHMGFNVKELPGRLYNYPPKSADDPQTEKALIVHYKGNRKKYLGAA